MEGHLSLASTLYGKISCTSHRALDWETGDSAIAAWGNWKNNKMGKKGWEEGQLAPCLPAQPSKSPLAFRRWWGGGGDAHLSCPSHDGTTTAAKHTSAAATAKPASMTVSCSCCSQAVFVGMQSWRQAACSCGPSATPPSGTGAFLLLPWAVLLHGSDSAERH